MTEEFVIDEETKRLLQIDSDACCVGFALNSAAELRTFFSMDRPQSEKHRIAANVRRVLAAHGFSEGVPITTNDDRDTDDRAEEDAMVREAERLLPAWFTLRMMMDNWYFGLLLMTGEVLAIACIDAVRESKYGTVWIDVEMLDSKPFIGDKHPFQLFTAPTLRTKASVNAAHVVAAFRAG